MRNFRSALSFLTILPAGGADINTAAVSIGYFPLVGWLLGAIAAATAYILRSYATAPLAAVAITVELAIFSGGLHLDGLADTADGIVGGADLKSRLAIMRDSRVGAFGALALILTLLVKYASLTSLAWKPESYIYLAAAPAWSRWAAVYALYRYKAAGVDGLGALFVKKARPGLFWAATIMTAAPLFFIAAPLKALLFGIIATFIILPTAYFLSRPLNGITGDILGALIETCEALILVSAVIVR